MLTVEEVRKALGKRPDDDDVGALLGEHPASIIDEDASLVARLLQDGFDRGRSAGASGTIEDEDVALAVEEIEDIAGLIGAKQALIGRLYRGAVREGLESSDIAPAAAEEKPARKTRQRKPQVTAAT